MAFKDTLNKTKKNAKKKAKEKKYAEKPGSNTPAKISEVVKVTPTKAVNGKAQTATKTLPKSYKETKGSTVAKLEAQNRAGQQWERSKAAGLDSSSLTPLNLLKRDAISGTTTRDKIRYARTSGAVGRLSSSEVKAKNKKAGEARAARDQKSAAQVLSRKDKRLSKREQTLIRDAKTSYDEAREKGDKAGMQAAHKSAEIIRKSHGYSGGVTGQESISPELTHEEKVLLNKTGQERLKMAKMNLEAAKAAGNENGIAAAERAVKRILETDAFRNEGTKKLSGFVTGHGQTVDRKPLSMEEFKEGEKKFNEGLYSVMAAVPGSILSLVETSNQAIENDFLEKNRDYINDKANRLQEYKTKLELAKKGEGNPKWGSIAQLEQQVKIAERAEKMRSAGTTVDPNLPGQTLMRKSTEAQQKFMEGRTGVDRLLASAGLSMGQMIPALAASAIPGVGPAIGAGIMGTQAAGSKAYELNERGVSPAESQMRGIVSGGIEAVTEKIPISSLLKVVKAGGGANLLKSMAKQAGIEATEESISYALNHAADVAYKDPEAKFSMSDLLESAAVGAISGAAFGGIGSAIGSAVSRRTTAPQASAQESAAALAGQEALLRGAGLRTEELSPAKETAAPAAEQAPAPQIEEMQAVAQAKRNTDNTGIKVYRGTNRSSNPLEKNLANNQTVYDVIGKSDLNQYPDLVPLVFYTADKSDAENYANMDKNTFNTYLEMAKFDYRGEIMKGRAIEDEDAWTKNRAMEMYKISTGNDTVPEGFVTEHTIHPQKVLDLSNIGETPTVNEIYKEISKQTGISDDDLDTMLYLLDAQDIDATADDPLPVWRILRNGRTTHVGSRMVQFMRDFGYDAFSYSENGAKHYAVLENSTASESPRAPLEERSESFRRRSQAFTEKVQQAMQDPAQNTEEVKAALQKEADQLSAEYAALTQESRQQAGEVSRGFGTAENHIDNRTTERMADRSIKAFQFDHPQLHQYYVQAAEALKRDAEYSFETQRSERGNGTVVRRSEQLERAESMGLTRNEIIRVCDDIIADNGQENYAAAKRVELILDDMLSRGYIPNEGTTEADTKIPANEAYIQAKNQIPGAVTGFDRYKRDNALSLELGEVTEEELRAEYESGLPEGQGAMSKGGAGAFASWQAERSNFHPIGQDGYARTAEEHGRAPVEIPTRDPAGMLTSKTASTLANASVSNNQLVQALEEDAAAGGYSYTAYGDRAALAQAEARIREIGFQRAKEEWIAEARAGKLSKDNTAMGLTLINNAANSGTLEGHIDAHDLIGHYISYARTAGQALQAMNMVNRMTPTGQLYTLVKTAENLEINIKNRTGKDVDITIDPELSRRFTEAETQEERNAIRQEIYRDIAAQVPNTWRDKFDAWRYLSMLGNPRTHIRNIAGNLFFDPVRVTKNVIGTGLESVFSRNDRTKTITSRALSAEDRARYLAAKADFQEVKDVVMSGGKYNDEWSQIDEYRTIFKTKPLEAARKANTAALEAEDRFFSSRAYADSLTGFLKANKITAEEYLSPDFDKAMKEKAREYAIREAQKATYRDLNAASELVSGLSRFKRSDKAFNRAVGYLVEGVLPFKKTPTNIAVRAVEYSPAGLVKGLADAGTKVRRGEMSAAEAIDEIASGLTGTGLLALGAALSHAGFVLGGSSGDDKQDDFDKLQGHQEYALEIGGESVTLDWLAPEALPFFVGVELEKFVSGLKSGETEKADWSKAATRILEPMLEMSMLQSLNDVINSVGSEVPFVSSVASAAMSYLGQFVPTLGGQIERSFLEDTRQQTVIDKESAIPSSVQYMLGTIGNKIPIPGVDFYQQDYVDAWGRKKSTGTILNRVLNNFLNPAYVSKLNTTDVDAELQRLYDGGYDGVFPGEFGKSIGITVDEAGKKTRTLTAEERQKAQETRGKTAYDLLSKTMADGSYQSMTDAEKAKFVDSVYEYAKAVARIEAGEDPEHYDSWIGKSSDYAEKTGGDITDFFLARNKKNQIDADDNKQDGEKAWEFETWVDGQDRLSADQKSYLKENLKIWGFHPADSSKYVKGTSAGLSVEQIRMASDAYSRADTEFGDGNGGVKQGELWQSIKALGLSDEESAKLYEQAKPKNWKATWYTSKRQ